MASSIPSGSLPMRAVRAAAMSPRGDRGSMGPLTRSAERADSSLHRPLLAPEKRDIGFTSRILLTACSVWVLSVLPARVVVTDDVVIGDFEDGFGDWKTDGRKTGFF